MIEPLTNFEVREVSMSACLPPSQAAIKQPVFDAVRNEFIAAPSPSARHPTTQDSNDKDQMKDFPEQNQDLFVSMLDNFDFLAFPNSLNFEDEEMYGFSNLAFIPEPDYHS